jgi:sec-independent protein translocase protein TatA
LLVRGNVVYLQNKLKNFRNMFGLGFQEILVIALIVLLLWGGKKIPELMHGLGKGVKSFKDGMNEVTNLEEVKKEEPEKKDE